MGEQGGHVVSNGGRVGVGVVNLCEQIARRVTVESTRVVNTFRLCTESRQQRHLPGDRRVQCIDRLHAQARRMAHELPAALGVARQHGTGKTNGVIVVARSGPLG